MGIDTSGKWWVGSDPNDIRDYLAAYSSDGGYQTEEFRLAQFRCGSFEFVLEADDTEGTARRTCAKCKVEHFICDSEEHWEDSEPQKWSCECQGEHANVGVGFALYPEDKEVKMALRRMPLRKLRRTRLLCRLEDWLLTITSSNRTGLG